MAKRNLPAFRRQRLWPPETGKAGKILQSGLHQECYQPEHYSYSK